MNVKITFAQLSFVRSRTNKVFSSEPKCISPSPLALGLGALLLQEGLEPSKIQTVIEPHGVKQKCSQRH